MEHSPPPDSLFPDDESIDDTDSEKDKTLPRVDKRPTETADKGEQDITANVDKLPTGAVKNTTENSPPPDSLTPDDESIDDTDSDKDKALPRVDKRPTETADKGEQDIAANVDKLPTGAVKNTTENSPPPDSLFPDDESSDDTDSDKDKTLPRVDKRPTETADKGEQDITANVDKLPTGAVEVLRQTQAQAGAKSLPIIGFSIHLPGRNEPITIKTSESVIIGRKDRSSNVAPVVDLSADHAALLGVSRQHAEIIIRDNQGFLRDLDSANGTWLNEKFLTPNQEYAIYNGDQIRLGHLICFIYLIYARSTGELASLEEHITNVHLVDSSLNTRELRVGLSSHYLMTVLGNFLDAVIGLQMLLNEIATDARPEAAIKSFSVDQRNKRINVELKNVKDIIAFLDRQKDLWQAAVFDDTQTNATALKLANALWNTLDKTPDEQRDHYIGLLQTHFKTLVRSNLKLMMGQDDPPPAPPDRTSLL